MSRKILSTWRQLDWHRLVLPTMEDDILCSWLAEENSLTQRLRIYCKQVVVTVLFEGIEEQIGQEAYYLPVSTDGYWVREVILEGDNSPWLLGRTIISLNSQVPKEHPIFALGKQPLGDYLFNHTSLQREFIQVAEHVGRWGRRSKLWLGDMPVLLTEVFLEQAPCYTQGLREVGSQ